MSAGLVKGARAGSRVYQLLQRLHQLGGQAAAWDWQADTGHGAAARFLDDSQMLVDLGAVFKRGDHFHITDAGLVHLGEAPHVPAAEPIPPAAPRLAMPIRAQGAIKRPRPTSLRAGAFDYLDIPSRYGAVQKPYRSALRADDETGGQA